MQALINDLLAFSRVGRIERPRELVDVGELVRTTGALGLAIEEAGGHRRGQGPLPEVYAERTLLGLVLQNLIANAIKFRADKPPHVRVSARRDGDYWELAVSDNGIGIEPQYADRIFIIFQRCTPGTPMTGPGSGWPCAARSSSTTEGTSGCRAKRQRVDLSLHAAGVRHRHRGGRRMNENLNVISVLLVEDDPGDVVLIREAFEDNKVHNALHVVSDGVEAMAFLRNEGEHADAPRPDLVLLDLNLPRMDGREVLAEVKATRICARSRWSC